MKNNNHRWQWWVILLWSYSTLVSVLMGVSMIFFPGWVNSAPPITSDTETIIMGMIVFLPQIIFLILIGTKNLAPLRSS